MKLVFNCLLFLLCHIYFSPVNCYAELILDTEHLEYVEYSDGKMFRQARKALLKYDIIQQKSEYWGHKIEKVILGDYAEKFMVFAPLITGKFEFNALEMKFYVDARQEESGVRYVYKF